MRNEFTMLGMTRPKVSVSVITYNQERYIAQTLDSILEQTVDFDFEIIIGDDCSTDNTRDIIRNFQSRFPSIIKPILHESKNPGIPGKLNFLSTIAAARGEYIALLDGDDYWTNSNKLQLQVDFLERNRNYSICFHGVDYLYGDNRQEPAPTNFGDERSFTIEDLAEGNFINALSVVFRNGFITDVPEWFYDSPVGDYIFHMLNAEHGMIKYFPDVMAVYRIHGSNIWSSMRDVQIREKSYQMLTCLLHKEFNEDVTEKLRNQRRQTANNILYQLFHQDRAAFLEKLRTFSKDEPQLINEWALTRFPALFESLEGSRSFLLAKKLSRLAQFFKK